MSSIAFNQNPEDNPFADPFANGRRSPDPWSSAYLTQETQISSEPQTPATPTSPRIPTTPKTPTISRPQYEPIEEVISIAQPPLKETAKVPEQQPTSPIRVNTTARGTTTPPPRNTSPPPIKIPAQSSVSASTPAPPPQPVSLPSTSASPPKTQPQTESRERIQNPLDFASPSTSSTQWNAHTDGPMHQQFRSLSLGGEVQQPQYYPTPSQEPLTSSTSGGVGWRMTEAPEDREGDYGHKRAETNGGWTGGEEDGPLVNGNSRHSLADSDDVPLANESSAEPLPNDHVQQTLTQPLFIIKVDDPQKVGADPIRAYTMYTVTTKTTSPAFPSPVVTVLRRYSDFLWLTTTLQSTHPGVLIPPLPEKSTLGRFEQDFIEQRRAALQRSLQKIVDNPHLQGSEEVKLFLTSDNFALEAKHRSQPTTAGSQPGLLGSITGPRFYESDEWFDQKKSYFDALEGQLRGLSRALTEVSKARVEMALSYAELSASLGELSSANLSKTMVVSLATLAEVERKNKEHQEAQGRGEELESVVEEYCRGINSVRMAFASRIRLYVAHQQAETDVRRLRARRAQSVGNNGGSYDRPNTLQGGRELVEIQEAERKVIDTKHDFDRVTRLIKAEVARFEKERIEEFKDSLEKMLGGMISRQKDIIKSWEAYQNQLLRKANPSAQATSPPRQPTQAPEQSSRFDGALAESDTNPFAS